MARPSMMDEPVRLDMRIPKALIVRMDRWRGAQEDVPSRSEAIRRLLEIGLDAETKAPADASA